MAIAQAGDLGQVGDDKDLMVLGYFLEFSPHDLGYSTADAGVHFVKN
jgi:hypothetical protein